MGAGLFSRSSFWGPARPLSRPAGCPSGTGHCRLCLGLARTLRCDHHVLLTFGGTVLLCMPACAFPVFTRQRRVLTCALSLTFSFFQALTRPPKLVFRKPHPLLGHVGLQSGSIDDLRRFCILGRRVVCGGHFAACFFHGLPARRGVSLTQAAGACHRALQRYGCPDFVTHLSTNALEPSDDQTTAALFRQRVARGRSAAVHPERVSRTHVAGAASVVASAAGLSGCWNCKTRTPSSPHAWLQAERGEAHQKIAQKITSS